MYKSRKELLKVIRKHLAGRASPEEEKFLEAYYDFFENEGDVSNRLQLEQNKLLEQKIESNIWKVVERWEQKPIKQLWPRIAVAASIILFVSFSAYFIVHKTTTDQYSTSQKNDIAPGSNKAVLTLANGKQIILTNAQNGKLAIEGNTAINKTSDGNVVYTSNLSGENVSAQLSYNVMQTPLGGQYHLTLADGTRVWLNAASSIKYPTAFTGNERKVEITGEAYFEVAHNAAKPFRVMSNTQLVEVLGTHFNINAYADENSVKTTLIEGSVRISTKDQVKVITPGQQSALQNDKINVNEVDVDEAIAWKNGEFQFSEEKIGSVMRKLSRWYNIEVHYQGITTNEGFTGAISRGKNISQILKMLEDTKAVHFNVEGRRVTVISN